MTIAMTVASWGNYWERYGVEFIDSLEAMNPRFDEVVIVSEQDLIVPSWIRVERPRSEVRQWDWFNEAVEACSSEWVTLGSIDDPMFPDALEGLNLEGDLLGIGCISGTVHEACPGPHHWKAMMDVNETLIWCASFIRRSVFQRFPWRRVFYQDWMQWLEMRYAEVDVRFDPKPRFRHRLHDDSHSAHQSPLGNRQVREFKRMLATGLVVPGGIEWPPLGGDWKDQLDPPMSKVQEAWLQLRSRRRQ